MSKYISYKVGRDGVILGVFDEPEMVYMIQCGKVVGTDDFWTEGMSNWAKVASRTDWVITGVASIPPAKPRSLFKPLSVSDQERKAESSTSIPSRAASGVQRPPVSNVSFFSIWWKTTLALYLAYALLGGLNAGEYGLGVALGKGLFASPLLGLLVGGIIYACSFKKSPDADHARMIKDWKSNRDA